MKKKLLFFVILITTARLFSTAQIGDVLLYQGEEHYIHSNPLEDYFIEHENKPYLPMYCTAYWRGYVAYFEVKDDFLYLNKVIKGTCIFEEPEEIPLSYIFPRQEGPIKADWYSGTIRIPQGEVIHYIHMGYLSIYEKDLCLKFENGRLIEQFTIDNSKRIDDFLNLPETKDLKRELKEQGFYDDECYQYLLRVLENIIMDRAFNDPEFSAEVFKHASAKLIIKK